jgi:hypothetical protein
MIIDEAVIQFFAKVAVIGGVSGYVIHAFYTRYCKFQDDIYDKVGKRLTTDQCDKYRGLETLVVKGLDEDIKMVNADLQRHKEAGK